MNIEELKGRIEAIIKVKKEQLEELNKDKGLEMINNPKFVKLSSEISTFLTVLLWINQEGDSLCQ